MKGINLITFAFITTITFNSTASELSVNLQAAKLGDIDAQVTLGIMYENGRGVTQDYYQAVEWYNKAAELGNVDAQLYLGFMYEKGQGVEKSMSQSYKWFATAAAQGYKRAHYYLGFSAADTNDIFSYSNFPARY